MVNANQYRFTVIGTVESTLRRRDSNESLCFAGDKIFPRKVKCGMLRYSVIQFLGLAVMK